MKLIFKKSLTILLFSFVFALTFFSAGSLKVEAVLVTTEAYADGANPRYQMIHPSIKVQDNIDTFTYPMPIYAEGKDEVFVGRIRRDYSQPNTLNMWIVSDNLRKGAATNAVQIAEYLLKNKLV